MIDQSYQIIEDSYDQDVGKTIVSVCCHQCSDGESISNYDERNSYIEVTSPIPGDGVQRYRGRDAGISVSTDNIVGIQENLKQTMDIIFLQSCCADCVRYSGKFYTMVTEPDYEIR